MTLRTANYFKLIRTGVNEITSLVEIENNKSNFNIAPNPTNDIIHISSEKKLEGDVLCEVFDLNGQLLFAQHYGQADFDLDLSAYPPGGYVVRIVAAGQLAGQLVLKR